MTPSSIRKTIIKLSCAASIAVVFLGTRVGAEDEAIRTDKDRISYSVGVTTARNVKLQGVEIDLNRVVQGMRDELAGKALLMNDEEIRATMMAVQTDIRQRQRQAKRLSAADNRREGDLFLKENAKKDGVVSLPDGLQYAVVRKGEGRRPSQNDTAVCRYRTTLVNGTEIDNTFANGRSVPIPVKDALPGLREALGLMPVGSRWTLFVPPALAYGETGSGMTIGPNEVLIFDIELLSIK